MCRNIKTLHNFDPPATDEEIRGSHSTWARRLLANRGNGAAGLGRTVVLVRLRSCDG